MRKLILMSVFGLLALLSACAGTPEQKNRDRLAGIVSSYGVAVSAANGYAHRPLCPGNTRATIDNPCADRATIRTLQSVDRAANAAINKANLEMQVNPGNPGVATLLNDAASAVASYNAAIPK